MNAATHGFLWPQAVNNWGVEEEEAAIEVIRGGHLTMGSKVREFEAAFAAYVGARHAVMCNSGSSANLLAVAARYHAADGAAWQQGDEAIVPALAWSTTYAPLQQYGLKLRVVDIDQDTLNIDEDDALHRVGPRTKVLVGVNILGNPARLDALRAIADHHGLFLLEDNCESLGATVGGRHCGTFGDVGTYSFFFSHHLNTIEGGMLVTNHDHLADVARCLRAHGWTRDVSPGSWLHVEQNDFDRAYDFVVPGYNLRPSELAAAVGLVQLKKMPGMQAQRQRNAEAFDALEPQNAGLRVQRCEPGAVPFSFPLIAPTPQRRAELVDRLKACGIESRMVAGGCFARQRARSWYDWETAGVPHADRVHDCGLMIGNHPAALQGLMPRLAEALFE